MTWTPFWFEGNQWFGMVSSPMDWAKVKATYVVPSGTLTLSELMRLAKECPESEMPEYGFDVECTGPKTLREFFDEHGMVP